MDLRRVSYFVAVANTLHFGKAAEIIGIAQPALSQQIKLLEQEVGGELLCRNKRTVLLTDAGKVFLEEAKKLLNTAHHAQQTVHRAFAGEAGELRIGLVESGMWDILPKAIKAYHRNYSDVKLTFRQLYSKDQLTALEVDDIDIGIIGLPMESSNHWKVHLIRNDTVYTALPKEHPLANHPSFSLGALANDAFILTKRNAGSPYYDTAIKACLEYGFYPRITQEVENFQTALSLVSSGLGVALVPASARYLRNDVIYIPTATPESFSFPLSFIWLKNKQSPILDNFISTIKTCSFSL